MHYIISRTFPPGSLVYKSYLHPWILLVAGEPRQLGATAFFLVSGLHPHAEEFALSPQALLDFRPLRQIGGERPPPLPGEKPWFESACDTAGCLWLLPLVKAMAEGLIAGPDEILKAYALHNGGKQAERDR